MKIALAAIAAILITSAAASAQGSHYRSGYTTKGGTYVAPTRQTNPNSTRLDNYSTVGNYNPYNGRPGYKLEVPAVPTLPRIRY